jgi:dimethylaniline monooxygenase (N-oxide forming)
MRVAVVGAGPSGLVTLKYLLEAHKFLGNRPIEARLFEREDYVGGTFVGRTYEDAEVRAATVYSLTYRVYMDGTKRK